MGLFFKLCSRILSCWAVATFYPRMPALPPPGPSGWRAAGRSSHGSRGACGRRASAPPPPPPTPRPPAPSQQCPAGHPPFTTAFSCGGRFEPVRRWEGRAGHSRNINARAPVTSSHLTLLRARLGSLALPPPPGQVQCEEMNDGRPRPPVPRRRPPDRGIPAAAAHSGGRLSASGLFVPSAALWPLRSIRRFIHSYLHRIRQDFSRSGL